MAETERSAPASPPPDADGNVDDKNTGPPSVGRGSPESVASDATPVTKNAAPTKRKGNLHSMWESKTTSWSANSPQAPPKSVQTSATTRPKTALKPSPKPTPKPFVKNDEDELALLKKELDSMMKAKTEAPKPKPPPVASPQTDELALLKKELEAMQGKKEESKPLSVSSPQSVELALLKEELEAMQGKKEGPKPPRVSSSPKTPVNYFDSKLNVKKEAKKFESKLDADDELALLKEELETIQGKLGEEPKIEEAPPTKKKKKSIQTFWEEKTKHAEPLTVYKSTVSPSTKQKKDLVPAGDEDGANSDAADPKIFAATVTAAAAATAFISNTVTEGISTPPKAPLISAAVMAAPSTTEVAAVADEEDKSLDNDSVTSGDTAQLMTEFRTLVEKLVRKAMPSEIDHIDELIQEYEGREEELLEILSAMQTESEKDKPSKDDGSTFAAAAVAGTAVAGSQVKQTSLENMTSFESELHIYEDDLTAPSYDKSFNANSVEDGKKTSDDKDVDTVVSKTTVNIGNVNIASPEVHDSDIETGEAAAAVIAKSDKKPCWKRNRLTLITLAIIVILACVAVPIGILFSSAGGGDGKNGSGVFEKPIGDGRPMPGITGQLTPGVSPDGKPSGAEGNLSTFCTSDSDYSELALKPDVKQLKGNNPLVAVDGTNAVVVTGSGYVSFYSLQDTEWQLGETFGILASHGDVASVSISGNTAVIGLPKAAIAVGPSGPVSTGMIVTYERNPESGVWRQAKEVVPNEYSGRAERYKDSDFGQSVSIYSDLLVVGAPSEESNQGSVTVFKKNEKGLWDQVKKLDPGDGVCENENEIYLGYSVILHKDTIAASSDCAENIVLYQYDRAGGRVKISQVLPWVDKKFGAVASIGMNDEYLVYSTVEGGLFIFQREGNSEFSSSQDLTFNKILGLFEYPVAVSSNLFVLAVGNEFYLFTQAEQGAKWMREPLTLVTDGDFLGYFKPGLGVSNDNVLLGSNTDIKAYDLSKCVPEESVVDKPSSDTSNCVVVSVTLDVYPTDTSWAIADSNGNVAAKNTPYEESMADSTQVEEVCDLSDGDYSFTIFDEYGDGICCEWGNGSYIVTTKGGLRIASGGEFEGSEMTPFSIPFTEDSTATKPTESNNQTPEPNCINVSVTLDVYPTDTSWAITDSNGNVAAKNTPYEESMADSTQVEEVCDLSDGDYSFTIFDEYGDGICCEWGNGSYIVTTKGGLRIASGGEFEGSEMTPFSIPFTEDSTASKPTEVAQQTSVPTIKPRTSPAPTQYPTIQAPVTPACTTIEISVTLDDYPADTSWSVFDSAGRIVATSPGYDASMVGSTQVESTCLSTGTYSFEIYDVYEDGICCNWGNGSYTLTTADGQLLASGGEWVGASETKTFTVM